MTKYKIRRFKNTLMGSFSSYEEARSHARKAVRRMHPAKSAKGSDRQVAKLTTCRWYGFQPNITDFGYKIVKTK